MRKFFIKAIFFCIPMIALGFEVFLPLSTFTFRPHEALLYIHPGIGMPFYPDHTLIMKSEGDLCYYSAYAIKKDEKWITDKIGYRNDKFIEDPDIMIIGDSFVLGMSTTQDSILSNLLMKKSDSKWKVYNLSQASLSDFKVLLKSKIFKKPKLIVFSIGERDIPEYIKEMDDKLLYKSTTFSLWKNKATRLNSVNYFMARTFNQKLKGVQSEIDKNMFFFKGKNQQSNLGKIRNVVEVIDSYKYFCDSLGIKFLFLPLPNKETVYYDKVLFIEQPCYLFELDNELRKKNIATINSLKVFNLYRKENNSLIYHLDDTHWNSNGINIIADEIVKEINTNPQLGI